MIDDYDIDNVVLVPFSPLDSFMFDSQIIPDYLPDQTKEDNTQQANQLSPSSLTRSIDINRLNLKRFRWTQEEDDQLKKAVEIYGAKKWEKIAEYLPYRNAKQCRERWIVRFDKKFNHDPWTKEEDKLLIIYQNKYGNKFSAISKMLPRRSSIQVKNRWKYLKKHNLHMLTFYEVKKEETCQEINETYEVFDAFEEDNENELLFNDEMIL